MSVSTTKDFCDEPGEAIYRNMFSESMIIDPIRTIGGMVFKTGIVGGDTRSATTETGSSGIEIKPIGASKDTTRCIGPAIAIISSLS